MKKSLNTFLLAFALIISITAFTYTNLDSKNIKVTTLSANEQLQEEASSLKSFIPELGVLKSVIKLVKKNSPKL